MNERTANYSNTAIVYHRRCLDGFTAAWVAHRRFPGAELVDADFDELPPRSRIEGKRLVLVDISYPPKELDVLVRVAESVIVIDHHERQVETIIDRPYVYTGKNKSGALLAWEFFNSGRPPPLIVQYANDHDLWRFKLPHSKAVTSALEVYPKTLPVWDSLAARLDEDFDTLLHEGTGAMLFRERLVEDFCSRAMELEIGGNNVLGVECPRDFRNEVASALADGRLFGVAIQTKPDGRRAYSLRVRGSGFRVDKLAETYGGGGHPDSAAFSLDLDGKIDPFQVVDQRMLDALNTSRVPTGKG